MFKKKLIKLKFTMMTKNLLFNKAAVALLCVSMAFTACKKKSDDPAPSSPPDQVTPLKTTNLSGNQEVPAATNGGSGMVEASYNNTSNVLTYKITYSGVVLDAIHIHSGMAGTNGAVAFTLAGATSSPVQGTVTLSAAQELELLAGKLYVNGHSAAQANGALRAQLLTSDVVVYQNDLSGLNQVPAVTTTSTGTFYGTFNKSSKIMDYAIVYAGTAPNSAHIHEGLAGSTGAVAFTLTTPIVGTTTGTTAAFTAAQQASLEAGGLYVNVHSASNANGEVRAQLANSDVKVVNNILLSGNNEVPAVTTTASATAYVTYNDVSKILSYTIITTNLTSPTSAHIHEGDFGVAGGVVFTLTTPATGSTTTTGTIASVTAAQKVLLDAGHLYFNIHTTANAGGELRGQVQ